MEINKTASGRRSDPEFLGRPGPELVSGFGRTDLAILGAAVDKELLPGLLAFGRAGGRARPHTPKPRVQWGVFHLQGCQAPEGLTLLQSQLVVFFFFLPYQKNHPFPTSSDCSFTGCVCRKHLGATSFRM